MGLAGVLWAQVPTEDFTLAWTHTIEKVRWEEDYHLSAAGLELGKARIKGSGAGMEPPEGAWLEDGSWHYQHPLAPLAPLRLARTPEAGDYQLCWRSANGTTVQCQALSHWLGPPQTAQPAVELWSCEQH